MLQICKQNKILKRKTELLYARLNLRRDQIRLFKQKSQEQEEQLNQLNEQIKEYEDEIYKLLEKGKEQEKNLAQHKSELEQFGQYAIQQESEISKLNKEVQSKDKNLAKYELKHKLISAIIDAKSYNNGLELYKQTLNGKFLEFANKDNFLSNEAEIFLDLQEIQSELEVIASSPNLHQKNIIAIGGGFSAGKSEFISSFMSKDTRLPIKIKPTTAIPTYVLKGEKCLIGCNNFGARINLSQIDDKIHSKLDHDFIESFGFNLKAVLPFIILQTDFKFENICFLDTPGYNPANTNYDKDHSVSHEFLQSAKNIIWLISAENGTIQNSDLEFLSSLNLDNKKFYLVINKADIKANSDLEYIMQNVKETLDDEGIKYEGIQIFSSIRPNLEPKIIGKSLNEFLEDANVSSTKKLEFLNKLGEIYISYREAIDEKIKKQKAVQNKIKSIELDIFQSGLDLDSEAFTSLGELKSDFKPQNQSKQIKLLDDAMDDFKEAIHEIFGKGKKENLNFSSLWESYRERKQQEQDLEENKNRQIKSHNSMHDQKLEGNKNAKSKSHNSTQNKKSVVGSNAHTESNSFTNLWGLFGDSAK